MLSCAPDDEELMNQYILSIPSVYREAPAETDRSFSGHFGLLLESFIASPPRQFTAKSSEAGGAATRSISRGSVGEYDSRFGSVKRNEGAASRSIDDEGDAEEYEGDELKGESRYGQYDNEEEELYDEEEELIQGLMQHVDELETEKQNLKNLNLELQKKAAALILREKAIQGQTAAGRGEQAAAVVVEVDLTTEQIMEKEKQYQDTLLLISEARNKLNKQFNDYQQLGQDLQTRLDDKEAKEKSISTSFKQFKKEILSKAEHSRTGHHIPKAQVQLIEAAEAKREEELEHIRLKNIALRTAQKKLDREVRARDQLAEGLHMIDFEQLKIENQTFNEKIEERNEEIAKLKRKKTTTVQVLTHIREKLRFIEKNNRNLQDSVNKLDAVITRLRNVVTSYKLERDSIRLENKEWKAKQGFATNELLLTDYENQKNSTEILKAQVVELKSRYDSLTRQIQMYSGTGKSTSLLSNSKV